jgi:acyl carrier protein
MSDAADEIADKVAEIVVRHLGVAEASVVPTASFIDDLGADSLDTVELIMAFEETFRIEGPEAAARRSPPSRTRSTTSWRPRRAPDRSEDRSPGTNEKPPQ